MQFKTNIMQRALAVSPALLWAGSAMAQVVGPYSGTTSSSSVVSGITTGLCNVMSPFVGQSKFISLLFLIGLGVILVLWMLNENKEGVIVWLIRSGIVIGVVINIFTLPGLIGLPSPC